MKKKIILIFFVIMFIFNLTSCDFTKNDSKAHLESHLKDPDSTKYGEIEKVKYEEHIVYMITYNSKNSFGAYVGEKVVYVHYDGETWECSLCEMLEGNSEFYYSIGCIND